METEQLLKEIRVGNYIETVDGIEQMKFSDLEYFFERYYNDFGINPIPLTEEWLINLGFENKTLDYWGIKIFEKNGFVLDDKFAMMDIDIRVDFKTVHHLQNTFFALTGEELTLKN